MIIYKLFKTFFFFKQKILLTGTALPRPLQIVGVFVVNAYHEER